jgi:type I restriction enzyme S subunit
VKKGRGKKPLADLCEIFVDGDWVESKDQSSAGIRLIQTGNVGEGVFKNRSEKARYISEATFKRLRCTEIVEGDCLISRLPDPVGRSCILPDTGERMITAVDCTIVRFRPEQCLSEFFNLYSQSADYLSTVAKKCTGTTRIRISRTNLGLTPIPVPPLAEQQRIVRVLDEAFAGLATARANAEKNLQNGRALFESHLQSVFSRRGKGWVEKPMGELCQIKTGKKDVNEGNPDGQYPFFTCAAAHTYSDSFSFDAEALLVAGNGNVGQVSYFSGKFEAYQRTYVLFDFREVSAKYLYRVLDKRLSATVGKQKLGNTMPYIKVGMLSDFPVPVLPPAEQARVTEEFDALATKVQRLESLYKQKLAALATLKESLLHQAFSGEL